MYNDGYGLDAMENAVKERLEGGYIDVEEIIKALVWSRYCELSHKKKVEEVRKLLDRIVF